MSTPRATMKTRPAAKPQAIASGGRFKDIPSHKRPHAVDIRRKSAVEAGTESEEFEKQLLRAKKGAAKLARSSMEQAAAAWKVVRRSMKEAVAASKLATNKVARRLVVATSPARPAKTPKRHTAKASHGLTG